MDAIRSQHFRSVKSEVNVDRLDVEERLGLKVGIGISERYGWMSRSVEFVGSMVIGSMG